MSIERNLNTNILYRFSSGNDKFEIYLWYNKGEKTFRDSKGDSISSLINIINICDSYGGFKNEIILKKYNATPEDLKFLIKYYENEPKKCFIAGKPMIKYKGNFYDQKYFDKMGRELIEDLDDLDE